METLNTISSVLSIISFLISLFVVNKVYKIDKSISVKNNKKGNQEIKGDKNITSGRDSNITK
ncbi:hypothetical protein KU06062604_780009 [Flavobacterium psychrophilum]|uniref:hypothetical protein n=1 Tax=Flavobacterium psychrophilum TaxID=96345 RepID=UPI000B7C16C2|nr:hypothetical protein [Flavobacterium psychrophilum]SNB22489.1 hypothetical protein KU06062604_780009 [Flavobacterium psychrophilum]